jgi:hypothetical protein
LRAKTVRRRTLKRAAGSAWVDGKSWRLADEVRYIQRRAALHDGRFVSVGPLALFSTDTGDAWLLDPSEGLATRLARDGEPQPVHVEDTDTNFAVAWTGHYRINGAAFIYGDHVSGRVTTILGYPTSRIAELG